MFIHPTRLKHVLTPDCYWSEERHQAELRRLFQPGWHLAGGRADVARPGDFLTLNLLGQPLQLRNIDGEIHAFSNVCAHRHCLLTHQARGSNPRIRCQYHGWEYGSDGKTARIPEPKSFPPFDRDADSLKKYRVDSCGQLVFVSLSDDSPSLEEWLGPTYAHCAERFSSDWRQLWAWEADFPANWKIPVENTLEGYHVECIHPTSFQNMPSEADSQHQLEERFTTYRTPLPINKSRAGWAFYHVENFYARRLGLASQGNYLHYHHFPNLLLSGSDMMHSALSVTPVSATTSRGTVRHFGYRGRLPGWFRDGITKYWGGFSKNLVRQIMLEDLSIYADIQQGMRAASRPGVLGRMEERIFVFQNYVQQRCDPAAARLSVEATQ